MFVNHTIKRWVVQSPAKYFVDSLCDFPNSFQWQSTCFCLFSLRPGLKTVALIDRLVELHICLNFSRVILVQPPLPKGLYAQSELASLWLFGLAKLRNPSFLWCHSVCYPSIQSSIHPSFQSAVVHTISPEHYLILDRLPDI